MKFKPIILSLSVAGALVACAPTSQYIRDYVTTSKNRKIMVVPFESSAEKPEIGEEATELLSTKLNELGFKLVDRWYAKSRLDDKKAQVGELSPENYLEVAKEIGAKAFVSGRVTQAGDAALNASSGTATSGFRSMFGTPPTADGSWANSGDRTTVVYGATATLTDVSSGAVLWTGSQSDTYHNSTLKSVSSSVIDRLAHQIGIQYLKRSY